MFAGIYLKNFKCYQATQFVPIYSSLSERLVGYLGDNGVGKSAIIEALDAFFSNTAKQKWFRNRDAKKGVSESFIAPVFIITKKDIAKFDVEDENSDIENFSTELKKNIKGVPVIDEDQLLVCVAKKEDGSISLYDGKRELKDKKVEKMAKNLYQKIIEKYQFIYMGAEIDIDKVAKIDSEIAEIIIGSPMATEVEKQFKNINTNNEFVENLNKELEGFVDDKLTSKLKETDSSYSYSGVRGSVGKLTIKKLAEASIRVFLNSRRLKYKNIQLEDLSSGQRRLALFDFVIAILENRAAEKNRYLIFAIDEPEISVDTIKRIEQFEKLEKISKKEVSVMFTSHWYGWISNTKIGNSIVIEEDLEKNKKVFCSNKNNDFPFRKMPKYEMRMIFDFLVSLGSNAEASPQKYFILCEGPTDKNYLESSLSNANKYKIISVGKGRVLKMSKIFADYYWTKHKKLKNILFLIDTDPDQRDKFSKEKLLRRWSKDSDLQIKLENTADNDYSKCEIEDLLEPKILLNSLKKIIDDKIVRNLNIKYKDLFGIDAFGLDSRERKKLEALIKNKKLELSKQYENELLKSKKKTSLVKKLIENYFEE